MSSSNEELKVTLDMPRFATKGSSVVLGCNHNAHSHEVHKVEWHRNGAKIAQYIRERNKPFVMFNVPEGHLEVSL